MPEVLSLQKFWALMQSARQVVTGETAAKSAADETIRATLFHEIVVDKYEAFRATLNDHCVALAPFLQAFTDLARDAGSDETAAWARAHRISADLQALMAQRPTGQMDRSALYNSSLAFEKAGFIETANRRALNSDERLVLRALMAGIFKYFERGGNYNHRYGTLLGIVVFGVDSWIEAGRLDKLTILKVRNYLDLELRKMARAWGEVAGAFEVLKDSFAHGLKLELPDAARRHWSSMREEIWADEVEDPFADDELTLSFAPRRWAPQGPIAGAAM